MNGDNMNKGVDKNEKMESMENVYQKLNLVWLIICLDKIREILVYRTVKSKDENFILVFE